MSVVLMSRVQVVGTDVKVTEVKGTDINCTDDANDILLVLSTRESC